MNQRKSRSLVGLIGVLLVLLSILAVVPAGAAQGTLRIVKASGAAAGLTYTSAGATIILELTDSDLNKPLKRVLIPVASDSVDLAGTQTALAASTTVTSTVDLTATLAVGDTVLFPSAAGERVKQVATVTVAGFTTTTPFAATQTAVEARKVANAPALFAVCPDCSDAAAVAITVVVTEQVFSLPNFPLLDTNVGVLLTNRFTGAPDSVVNKQDARVVAADGSDYSAGLSITSLDAPNGTLRLVCAPACLAATGYVLYWTSTADQEGAKEKPAVGSRIQVKSNADAGGIGVIVTESGASTNVFERSVTLCSAPGCTSATSVPPTLQVGPTDVVTVTYNDANASVTSVSVSVESDPSIFSGQAPANNTDTTSPVPIVSGNVTDLASGVDQTTIREKFNIGGTIVVKDPNLLGGGGSVTALAAGGYAVTQAIPNTVPLLNTTVRWWILADDLAGNPGVSDRVAPSTLTGTVTTNGTTTVVGVGTIFKTGTNGGTGDLLKVGTGELGVDQTITVAGETRRVTVITDDVTITVDVAFTTSLPGQLAAKSTCVVKGVFPNKGFLDIGTPTSTDNGGCDPFTVFIDNTPPTLSAAITGRFWDTNIPTNTVSSDRTQLSPVLAKKNSIMVDFLDSGVTAGLDTAAVKPANFLVTDGAITYTVTNAEVFSAKALRVFLTVSPNMPSGAKPLVTIVQPIKDKAGNSLASGQITAGDGIAPKVTVTIGPAAAVAGVILVTKDKVTLTITTDEPSVVDASSVVVKPVTGAATLGAILPAVAPTASATPNVWTVDVTPPTAGLYNVYITATDFAAQTGVVGETDPSKTTAILFQKDTAVGAVVFSPALAGSTTNPDTFIVFDYSKEGAEYGLTGANVCTGVAAPYPGCTGATDTTPQFTNDPLKVVTSKDTHPKVTLVSATLDGVSILADIATADNVTFLYKATGLSLGDHTVTVVARDEAGNQDVAAVSNTFTVKAVPAFDVPLAPGWNLISIPAEAADPALNAVISKTHPITTVLTFDATGTPLAATRDAVTGLLKGTLTSFNSNKAYWVHTTSFQKLSVTLATRGVSGAPPSTIRLKAGWNLVSVVTLDPYTITTRVAGDGGGGFGLPGSGYLAGTGYLRIYSYSTTGDAFVLETAATNLKTGVGYLVYVPKDVDLVP